MEEIYNYLTELAQIKDSFLTLVNCGFKKPEEMAACRERTKAQYEKAWEILNGQKSPETIMQWESKVVYGIIPEALLKADMDDRIGIIKMILRYYSEKFQNLTQEYLLDALYFQGYDDVQLLTRTKRNIGRAVIFLPKLKTVAMDFGVPFAKLAEEMGYDPDEILDNPQEYGEYDEDGTAKKEQAKPHLLVKQRVYAMKLLLKQAGISTKTTSTIKIAAFVLSVAFAYLIGYILTRINIDVSRKLVFMPAGRTGIATAYGLVFFEFVFIRHDIYILNIVITFINCSNQQLRHYRHTSSYFFNKRAFAIH